MCTKIRVFKHRKFVGSSLNEQLALKALKFLTLCDARVLHILTQHLVTVFRSSFSWFVSVQLVQY